MDFFALSEAARVWDSEVGRLRGGPRQGMGQVGLVASCLGGGWKTSPALRKHGKILKTPNKIGGRFGGGFVHIFVNFHPEFWGRFPILTNIFQMGWFNHQLQVGLVQMINPDLQF